MPSRDEVVRFVYDTTGDQNLANTAGLLGKMADAGKLTDAEAVELTATLKTLAAQSRALNDSLSQKAALAETTAQLAAAKDGAAALATEFDRADTSNKKVTAAFIASDRAVASLTAQFNQQSVALAKSEGVLQKAGIDTTNLAAANQRLQASALAASSSLARVGAGAAAVETANRGIGESYDATAEKIERFKALVEGVVVFLGLEKIADGLKEIVTVGERFDDLDKQFTTAFGSLKAGQDALAGIKDIAERVPQGFEDVAAAAIKLKRAGFDPLDGTLQALLDNQAALNQSQDGLIETIDALGKANIRGGVNIKSLVALTEAGIPVFDLLGTALGVSADRVRELATTGQLGQDAIGKLVAQLGKLRAGAAASELGDTDSQLRKLKDTAEEFLNTIAQSGALEFFRTEIKGLTDEVNDAAKSGKLKELAQSISDGIVGTANAIKTAVGFVYDYSGALVQLGKVYLTVKALNVAGPLLDSALALKANALNAIEAATAGEKAAGTFGKIGAAVRSIPTSLQLTIAAVGIDLVLAGLTKIITARREEIALNREIVEGQAANTAAQAKLVAAIDAVKAKYQAYADVALESGDLLKKQGVEQLKSYADQLAGARSYYNALAVEATNAGDAVGLASATAHLDKVNAELAIVNAQLKLTQSLGTGAAAGLSAGAAQIAAKLGEAATDSKAAGEIISKAFDGFDLRKNIVQVGDFAAGFDAVAAQGGKAADTLNATLLDSLKKLSGEDLLRFQSSAVAAIDSVGASGEATSATLKATLETALDRLGVKSADTGQKITKSGADIIASFTAVAENAQATSKTITAAFDAAIINAKTVDEVKALGAALTAAADTGKISFKELAASTLELDERIRTITAAISPLASQFDLLGIKSQAQLNATRDNAREAFDAIVQGARAGTAAQEDVIRAFKVYVDAQRAAVADSTQSAKDQVEEQLAVQASVLGLSDQFVKAGDAGKTAGEKTSAAFDAAKGKIDEAGAAAKDFGDDARGAAIAADAIGESAKANATAFATSFGGVLVQTENTTRALQQMNEILNQSGTLSGVSLQTAEQLLNDLGGFAGAQAKVLQDRISELKAAAAKETDAMKALADQTQSLKDQIDQLQGNDTDIEDRRHQKALDDAKAEAIANGTYNTAAYLQNVELENQLHALKLKNIAAEKTATEKSSTTASASGAAGTSANNGAAGAGTSAGGFGLQPINLTVNGGLLLGGSAQDVAGALAKIVEPQLARLVNLSR